MFAVLKTGGKQYKVSQGDIIEVEKIVGEVGSTVELGPVLMAADGDTVEAVAANLSDRRVTAKILAHDKGDKVMLMKARRRKDSRKKQGHRQWRTKLEIVSLG